MTRQFWILSIENNGDKFYCGIVQELGTFKIQRVPREFATRIWSSDKEILEFVEKAAKISGKKVSAEPANVTNLVVP